jgi:hypothetical protein
MKGNRMKAAATLSFVLLALAGIHILLAQAPPDSGPGARLAEQFRKADGDGDGFVTQNEFQAYSTKLRAGLGPAETSGAA